VHARIDPASQDVAVGRDPEGPREGPDEVYRRHVQDPARLGQGHPLEGTLVEEVPQAAHDLAIGTFGRPG
jgi:hypothetical protein